MKSAFLCLVVLGLCVHQSVGHPQQNGTEEGHAGRRGFGNPYLIHRLLQYPIGILKIVLTDESKRTEAVPVYLPEEQPTTTEEEAPVTEEEAPVTEEEVPVTEEEGDWQVLDLNETAPFILKSLISVPTRCKENEGLVGGRCRQVV